MPFLYGDPTGRFDSEKNIVKGGVFFTLYNPTKLTIDANSTYKGVINPTAVEYEAAVTKRYDGPNGALTPDLSSEQVDNIMNKHLFLWRNDVDDPQDSYLLHEPSIEERCVLIAKAFKQVPRLLEFCWMSHPEYLGFNTVSGIIHNRTSTTVVKADMDEDDADDVVKPAPAKQPASKPKPAPVVPPANKTTKSAVDIVDEFEDEIDDNDLEDKDDGEAKSVKKPKNSKSDFDEEEIDEDELDDAEESDEDDADEEDDEDDFGEEDETSDDFDDEADHSDVEAELEEQLNQSVSKANAIARSKTRPSISESNKPRRSK